MSTETLPPTTAPAPVRSVGVHKARALLPQLVKDAETGAAIELTRDTSTARLVPFADLDPQTLAHAPQHGIADARKILGDLVAQAAAGNPQLLRRHKTLVAALVPTTTQAQAPAPAPAAPDTASCAAPENQPVTVPPGPFTAPENQQATPTRGPFTAPAAPSTTTHSPDPASTPRSTSPVPVPGMTRTASNSTAPAPSRPTRRLAALGQALETILPPARTGPSALPGLPSGITALDDALGGLQPGRFYLVAGAPGVRFGRDVTGMFGGRRH